MVTTSSFVWCLGGVGQALSWRRSVKKWNRSTSTRPEGGSFMNLSMKKSVYFQLFSLAVWLLFLLLSFSYSVIAGCQIK
jgi:hypothetical protein